MNADNGHQRPHWGVSSAVGYACISVNGTGIAAADFSRIRNADLGRFTVDRLMTTLNRLARHVEINVNVSTDAGVRHEANAIRASEIAPLGVLKLQSRYERPV